jgi:hypothetical protein
MDGKETMQVTLGRDSSVSIATRYELDGPEMEFQWGRDFPHGSRLSLAPTSLLYDWYRVSFPMVSGRGVELAAHPNPAPRLKK